MGVISIQIRQDVDKFGQIKVKNRTPASNKHSKIEIVKCYVGFEIDKSAC